MNAGRTAIYFLVDPRNPGPVRYVGAALVPRVRHLQHCAETSGTPKGQWIESLRQAGILPQMEVVVWVDSADADKIEKLWIGRVRPDFLTNSSTVKEQSRKAERVTLAQAIVSSDNPADTLTALEVVEKEQIVKVLTDCEWNKLEAAKRLGIGRQTLYNKIKQYHLTQ